MSVLHAARNEAGRLARASAVSVKVGLVRSIGILDGISRVRPSWKFRLALSRNLIGARALFLGHKAKMQNAFSYFFLVPGKWLFGNTFSRLGTAEDSFWRELDARSYRQLESSMNSANLRTKPRDMRTRRKCTVLLAITSATHHISSGAHRDHFTPN